MFHRMKHSMEAMSDRKSRFAITGSRDFFLKVEDLQAFDRFVLEKLTKIRGIAKMQSSFVLNEIKHTTALKPAADE